MYFNIHITWYFIPLALFALGWLPILLSRRGKGLYKNRMLAMMHCLFLWFMAAGFVMGTLFPTN